MIVTWPMFKAFVDARSLSIQWVDDGSTYFLLAFDQNLTMECTLIKANQNAHLTEFETTYKSAGNAKLAGQKTVANSTSVTIASDQTPIPATIKGATDSTGIGNTGDRLKVDAQITSTAAGVAATISNNLRYVDMNVSNGGIARNTDISTSYSTVFNYSGSGLLFGFTINFEGNLLGADAFTIKLIVDSVTIFEVTTGDFIDGLYDLNNDGDQTFIGLSIVPHKTFRFTVPKNLALTYTSNITIQAKKTAGSNKQFRAGVVSMTKVT